MHVRVDPTSVGHLGYVSELENNTLAVGQNLFSMGERTASTAHCIIALHTK